MEFSTQDLAQFQWQLWRRVFGFSLLMPRPELDRELGVLWALGSDLWQVSARPFLEQDFPLLFDEPSDPFHRTLQADFRRVGATAYRFAQQLYLLHSRDESAAHQVGTIAMWMGIAGGVLDFLIDSGRVSPATLGERLSEKNIRQALSWDGNAAAYRFDQEPCDPQLLFAYRTVERAFSGLRERLAAAPRDAYNERLHYEITACVQRMVVSELRSPMLRLSGAAQPAQLEQIEEDLRTINTLCIWLSAYVGLLAEPRPGPEVLEGLLRVATLIGEVGWILDSLSDVHEDLQQGVFSKVWLTLAREGAADLSAWLPYVGEEPQRAVSTLLASTTLDRLLSRTEVALREIERQPHLPQQQRAQLGRLCRMMVWSFLCPRLPEPDGDGLGALQ
jgi:hypothetical protein